MKRRHFLQFTASTLATLGINYLDIVKQGNQYGKVLAQNTPRKLALLVGVNQYPNSKRFTNLNGCVTDVDLQQALLIHRFGFNPKDIIRITSKPSDIQPTRKNILTAFEEHLIKQAKPGDVVVFHFSGHGSTLPELDPIQKQCRNQEFNSALVPADDVANGYAQDIMGRTLFLLRLALQTDNITMVLDSCYSGGGTRGNFLIRSLPGDGFKPHPEELAYQQRWIKELGLSETKLAELRCAGVGKGVVIAAAKQDEEATDAKFDGFRAGAFTYFLTQYLWQQSNNVGDAVTQIARSSEFRYNQEPIVDGNPNQPVYFIDKKLPPTDAVITNVQGNSVTLWLGGVDKESLPSFNSGATFAIVNDKGQPSGELKLQSREGLIGKAVETRRTVSMQAGMLLQETSRVIPTDIKLNVGLDASLAKEAIAIKQALGGINRIQLTTVQSGSTGYPVGVQYILSRMTADNRRRLQKQGISNLAEVGCIGLFTEGLEVIPQSFGKVGEKPTDAVSRLESKLKALLAIYVIKKTLNANSSNLDVEVSMSLVDRPKEILAKVSTLRSGNSKQQSGQIYSNKLPINKFFQLQVTNNDPQPVYLIVLFIDAAGSIIVAFPYEWPVKDAAMLLASKQPRVIGNPEELELIAKKTGSGEALIIVSRSPFKNTIKTLRSLADELNQQRGSLVIDRNPEEVIGDLLDDLRDRGIGVSEREVKIKTAEIATLSLTFEMV